MNTTTNTNTAKSLPAGIVKKTTGYSVDPSKIARREGWNARFDFGDIKSLAASIKCELERDPSGGGLLNPLRIKRLPSDSTLLAKGFLFELIDGDRRLTAIESLLDKQVTFPLGVAAELVERDQTDLQSLIQMYTANTGKPFLPLEEADAFRRMVDGGMTTKQIAQAVGRTETTVKEALALLAADPKLLEAVKSGKVGVTDAKMIVNSTGKDAAAQAAIVDAAAAAGGKKAGKAAITKRLQDIKKQRAVAAGKTVKMRALTNDQLSAIGARMSDHLVVLLKEAGVSQEDTDLRAWVKADEKLAAAFALGALDALKVAAGQDLDLMV